MSRLVRYLCNLLIGIDQFGNIILLGTPEETISSRLGRAYLSEKQKWFVMPAMKAVDYVALHVFKQENHCVDSVEHNIKIDIDAYELWSWINQ